MRAAQQRAKARAGRRREGRRPHWSGARATPPGEPVGAGGNGHRAIIAPRIPLRRRPIATNEISLPRTAAADAPLVSLRARAGGYVVDMVIFAAVLMLITVIAGAILLFRTNGAEQDASDADLYAFLAIIGLGTPLAWSMLNLALLSLRGQTGGQYVAGVRLVRDDGSKLSPGAVARWWFCLNPLLFSWPMALATGAPLAAVVALALTRTSIVVFAAIVVLCAIAPIIAFVSALLDAENRTLHDRVVGTIAVPAE